MKKVSFLFLIALAVISCTQNVKIKGKYSAKFKQDPTKTSAEDKISAELLSTIKLQFDFKEDGKLMYKVDAMGQNNEVEMKWMSNKDTLFIVKTNATDTFLVTSVGSGYEFKNKYVTLALEEVK
jgi:hypothetical protein